VHRSFEGDNQDVMVALVTDGSVEHIVECGLVLLMEALKVDDRDMDVGKT
jgi:hypothetical protein